MKSVSLIKNIFIWNRKFHIYAGLFLLLFIWLFSFSGLLLNHSQWKFASFWDQRKESEIISPAIIPATADSSSLILAFMDQLKISGEVSNIKLTPETVDFRVMVPGINRDIHVDFKNKLISQKIMSFNFWGKIRILHAFNGANKTNPEIRPNWIVTRIWLFTINGIAIGLILLCISSLFMWYEVRKNYSGGLYVLILAFAAALYFIYLIRLM